jgi:hypothetical protein
MSKQYQTFSEFYPFYLSQHRDRTCRRLHFAGTTVGLMLLIMAVVKSLPLLILLGIATGYAFAWVGHYVFEKNRPATFTYPLYSFMGDWVMWKDMLTGRIEF